MFWGLILEPSKVYSQIVEHPFFISQAALDFSTGDDGPCQVMVAADRSKFLICTLRQPDHLQAPIGLYFSAGEPICFMSNGKCNVHLSGYLDPEFNPEDEVEEELEIEEDVEEDIEDRAPANKRKAEQNLKRKLKKRKVDADSSDSDSNASKELLTTLLDSEDLDTDNDDESFALSTSQSSINTSMEESDDEDGMDEEEVEEEEEDEEENNEEHKTLESADPSTSESTLDTRTLSKSQKRRLKKKLAKNSDAVPTQNGVHKIEEDKPGPSKKVKKQADAEAVPISEGKKEKKTLSKGVQIEDLKVGNGPVAKPGKQVEVYYEGRLKQNNKVFDKHQRGPGFKFRLGNKEVIAGWDTGVAGMRVGGVRKIICPPSMAYGSKGSPPVIPPNSTLEFTVEIKKVK